MPENALDTYLTVGAGGLAVLVLVWLVVYYTKKIGPRLEKLESSNEIQNEVIRNNTDAIKEVSRSNDNVATALSNINETNKALVKLVTGHNEDNRQIKDILIELKARRG